MHDEHLEMVRESNIDMVDTLADGVEAFHKGIMSIREYGANVTTAQDEVAFVAQMRTWALHLRSTVENFVTHSEKLMGMAISLRGSDPGPDDPAQD